MSDNLILGIHTVILALKPGVTYPHAPTWIHAPASISLHEVQILSIIPL
jgi:hypothetical protein